MVAEKRIARMLYGKTSGEGEGVDMGINSTVSDLTDEILFNTRKILLHLHPNRRRIWHNQRQFEVVGIVCLP